MISVVIPFHNSSTILGKCLQAVFESEYQDFECVIVNDSSTDRWEEAATAYPVRVVNLTGGPAGPAAARNCGAEAAAGDILFFVDADVIISRDTLAKVAETFEQKPEAAALFGSYDEHPAESDLLSQYKNLFHHYVHQKGHEEAATFWSGCGAIRKSVFQELGGFDAVRYPRPSIEDIELGYRLRAAGHKIILNKAIQVKHLKRWSLMGLIKTDVIDRALPWTQLIFKYRNLPNDLNLQASQRISTVLLLLMLVYLAVFGFQNDILLLPLLTGLFLLVANSWKWSSGPALFEMNPTVEKSSFLLIGSIIVAALFSNLGYLLAPLTLLVPILLISRLLANADYRIQRVLFAIMMALVTLEFTLLLASYPLYIVAPFLVILGIILLLNRQLYLFFARKRGVFFAIAVLPLQLFYYFYSAASFVIGGSIHYWNISFRSKGIQG